MAKSQQISIRPRDDSEDEEVSEPGESDQQDVSDQEDSDHDSDGNSEDEDADEESQSSIEPEAAVEGNEALKDISFGALAEAQARLNPNPRKRKLVDRDSDSTEQAQQPGDDRWKYDPSRERDQKVSRSSKHAPTIISSRNPVSRRREIFSPPASAKFRDPRFDAAVTSDSRRGNTSSTNGASKAYAFLNDYQAKEILDMKAQMKKIKDPGQQAEMKREIMSTEAKLRNAETQQREAEIMQAHKRKEREEIREGKKAKPYYLKSSEVKKQIIQERRDAMGKKARDKSDKRKKMREKTKEARDMPRVRRVIG